MKCKNSIILCFIVGFLFADCDDDNTKKTPCDSNDGIAINDQTGRIYKWANSLPHFFYIGNPTQVSTGLNGGYILCNELPDEFQTEGLIILYSGIDKGSSPDTDDPLFAYFNLTKIEKVE